VFLSGIEAAPFVAAAGADAALHPLTAHAWRALQSLSAADHLALATPHFMLRHPYGRRSDPVERFAFEEFNEREGLRALLWGHPAWLLATLLAGPDAGNAADLVDDLPFHYAVDRHGDQVALPCTDLLVRTDAAARLAAQGLVAVIGHRGLPQVQLAPLQTLGGLRLAGRAGAPRIRRGEVFSASANPRGALSAVLETELNKLLSARSASVHVNAARDPDLDALLGGPSS
jgi:type VI secretion system protein ImpC